MDLQAFSYFSPDRGRRTAAGAPGEANALHVSFINFVTFRGP